jgi:hypothetical protein
MVDYYTSVSKVNPDTNSLRGAGLRLRRIYSPVVTWMPRRHINASITGVQRQAAAVAEFFKLSGTNGS